MMKITLNDPLPKKYRNEFIHSLQNLGFHYDHIFSNGEYSLHKITGRISILARSPCKHISVKFLDDKSKEHFSNLNDDYIEIYFSSERK